MQNEIQLTSEDYMITMLHAQKEEKEKVRALEITSKDHERRIEEIEYNTPINASLNNYLTKVRNRNLIEFMGGKGSKAYRYRYPEGSSSHYKMFRSKVYKEAERAFQLAFNVRNYGETRQHQYEDAVKFWEEHEPSKGLLREIDILNGQTELFEGYS